MEPATLNDAKNRTRLIGCGIFLALIAIGLALRSIVTELGPRGFAMLSDPRPDEALRRVIVLHSLLPRAVIALLAGAALGLSGALLQRMLRNPIADASTLGVSAGAQLALVAAGAIAPGLGGLGRETLAFCGGGAAVAVVLALGWRRAFEPATVVLAGMVVGLLAASMSATLILFSGQYLTSMFLWGGGSLAQQSWGPSQTIAIRLIIAMALAALLLRPLTILALDDSNARNLGLSIRSARFGIAAVAVALAGSVVSEVGVIGFIGLAAPNLARMCGARRSGEILVASVLIGALILSLTDGLVQTANASTGLGMPTGAVAALLGGPFLIILLPRLRSTVVPPAMSGHLTGAVQERPWRFIGWLAMSAPLLTLLALTLGRDIDGLSLAHGATFTELLPWRWPRLAAAMAAGAMLGGAGTVVQRLTGNPLASPEVLGISSAAGLALALTITLVPSTTWLEQGIASISGAMLGLALLLTLARSYALTANHLLLGGIALASMSGAILTIILARGGLESFVILNWLTGSTQQIDPRAALGACIAALVLLTPLLFTERWLQILPLGDATSTALGLHLPAVKLCLIVIAGLLTGAASLIIGPISFVGLMVPHMVRAMGLRSAGPQLASAVIAGALLMSTADMASRLVFFPYQMPIGLFVSLIGAPYLAWALASQSSRQ
jgi:ferric hydroxamate transport system permease protein